MPDSDGPTQADEGHDTSWHAGLFPVFRAWFHFALPLSRSSTTTARFFHSRGSKAIPYVVFLLVNYQSIRRKRMGITRLPASSVSRAALSTTFLALVNAIQRGFQFSLVGDKLEFPRRSLESFVFLHQFNEFCLELLNIIGGKFLPLVN